MSDTILQKVIFQGGFNKNDTTLSAENFWVDGDKIRFRNGRPEKFGGWVREPVEQFTDTSNTFFTGVARDIHSWTDLSFNKYFTVAGNAKIEIFNGGQIYDVTPYREELTLNNAISTTSGSSIVSIADTTHSLVVGDYVFVDSQASAVDGITLSGEYQVVSVTDANNYTIDSGTVASGTTASAGGDLDINYLLEVGDIDNGNLTGYGGGTWDTPGSATITTVNLTDAITTNGTSTISIEDTSHGLSVGDEITVISQASAVDGIDLSDTNTFTGDFEVVSVTDVNNYTIKAINNVTLVESVASGSTSGAGGALQLQYGGEGWGRPRTGQGGTFLRQLSTDNWGEDLLVCVRDGKIYQWDATNGLGTRLQQISNAPTENTLILVAQPSRHLVAFGSQLEASGVFDPLIIRWASQETLTTWATADDNTAGEYRIPLGNFIVSAIQTRGEILILTDSTVYSMRSVANNNVFEFDLLADNVNAVSQHCGVDVNGIVYWMGTDNFYMYDGVVRTLESTLEEFIFDQDGGGRLNFEQKEKVYCSTNNEFNEIIWFYPAEGSDEVNRYVCYNYQERLWYDGTLDRTVWLDRSVFSKPFALDASGTLYQHEQGKDDDGSPMLSFIVSGDVDLDDGEKIMFVDRFIPDFKLVPNRNAEMSITFKKYPGGQGIVKGPYVFDNNTNQIKFRGRGRQASVRYEVDTLGADFEVGAPRFGIQIDGER